MVDEIELSDTTISNLEELTKYLQGCETAISKMIQNNDVLDSVVKDYIISASIYEQGLYQVVLYPVIRHIAKTYYRLTERIDELTLSDENVTENYKSQLSNLIVELEAVLERCNIKIDHYVSDTYDPKKHRILKMLETEDANLNGQVVCRYTDCYMMDDKVIYLSKVDVYKSKKN